MPLPEVKKEGFVVWEQNQNPLSQSATWCYTSWAILKKTHSPGLVPLEYPSPGWESKLDCLNCSGSNLNFILDSSFSLSFPSSSPYPIRCQILASLPPNCQIHSLLSTDPLLVTPLTIHLPAGLSISSLVLPFNLYTCNSKVVSNSLDHDVHLRNTKRLACNMISCQRGIRRCLTFGPYLPHQFTSPHSRPSTFTPYALPYLQFPKPSLHIPAVPLPGTSFFFHSSLQSTILTPAVGLISSCQRPTCIVRARPGLKESKPGYKLSIM